MLTAYVQCEWQDIFHLIVLFIVNFDLGQVFIWFPPAKNYDLIAQAKILTIFLKLVNIRQNLLILPWLRRWINLHIFRNFFFFKEWTFTTPR
jgi:hypothetical protein